MKKFYEEHRKAVKVTATVLILALIAVGVLAFIRYDEQRNIRLAIERGIDTSDVIDYGGQRYLIRVTAVNTNDFRYLIFKEGDDENYTVLPGEYAGWSPEIERIIYTDGKEVMSCDIDGGDRETVYRFSGRADQVVVRGMLGQYVIAGKSTDTLRGGAAGEGYLQIIDLISRESRETDIYAGVGPSFLAMKDGWLYYSYGSYISGTGITDYRYICRYNMKAGESQILTTENEETAHYGAVLGEYLYFIYDSGDEVYRMPTQGGEITPAELPALEDNGVHSVQQILQVDGNVYFLCLTDGGSELQVLLADDSGDMTPVYSTQFPDSDHIRRVRINGQEIVIVFRSNEYSVGTLSAA